MGFNGKEGGTITLSKASDMTAEWRSSHPGSVKARFFGKDIIKDILNQNGCMGIRIYFGIKDDEYELVVVGADANQNDMLDIIADISIPCPNVCGNTNDLNS